jgi:hypothetical protein
MDQFHHYTLFHKTSYKIVFWKRSRILCTTVNPYGFKLSSRLSACTNRYGTPISLTKLL